MTDPNINKDVTRKLGDDLFLGGTLGGENLPPFPWTGATLKITVAERRGPVVRDKIPVTAFDVTNGDWEYDDASLSKAKPHEYELLLSFADGKKRRFPNDRNLRLDVIRSLA